MATTPSPDPRREGLCARCTEARRIASRGDAVFTLCELSRRDDRFPRYPRLPVTRCAGFSPVG